MLALPSFDLLARSADDAAGQTLDDDFYGIAFPKGSDLVAKVNEALATLKSNGQYDAIYTKWFGKQP